MHKYLDKETQADLLKLGLYQAFGGGIGMLFVLWALIQTAALTMHEVLVTAIALTLFGYSVYCGFLCLYSKGGCLKHSLINQLFQLAGVSFAGFSYMYAAGVFLSVGLDASAALDIKFRFGISKIDLIVNDSRPSALHINLVALLLVLWIDRLSRRLKTEDVYHKIADIGRNEPIIPR